MHTKLLSEIDAFLAASGYSEARFGMLAARNGRFIERLRGGKRIWPQTEQRVRAWMCANADARPYSTRRPSTSRSGAAA